MKYLYTLTAIVFLTVTATSVWLLGSINGKLTSLENQNSGIKTSLTSLQSAVANDTAVVQSVNAQVGSPAPASPDYTCRGTTLVGVLGVPGNAQVNMTCTPDN